MLSEPCLVLMALRQPVEHGSDWMTQSLLKMTAWLYVPACQTMEDETRYCGCLEDLDKVGCPLALMSPDIHCRWLILGYKGVAWQDYISWPGPVGDGGGRVIYSGPSILRPPMGPRKCGLILQVVLKQRSFTSNTEDCRLGAYQALW